MGDYSGNVGSTNGYRGLCLEGLKKGSMILTTTKKQCFKCHRDITYDVLQKNIEIGRKYSDELLCEKHL